MKPAPRPPARVLLAGRFVVPRPSLLALPDGPVPGIDLASGELVALAFGPNGADADEVAARCTRWNELGLPGCPAVRELCVHLGRPLAIGDPLPAHLGELPGDDIVARAAQLGQALDVAGLGLPLGLADLAYGANGPFLRRPAIWPSDVARPLASGLAVQAGRLLERASAPVPAQVAVPRRARALRCCVPGSRRARLVIVLASGLVTALVASSLAGSSAGSGIARAAPHARISAARLVPADARPVPATFHSHSHGAPRARGGPARVLAHAPRIAAPAHAAVAPPAPREPVAAEPPAHGWVEGLFVGS